MSSAKIKTKDFTNLYLDKKNQSLSDKKIAEELVKLLSEKLQDPQMAKKAALILEAWLQRRPK